ncbi:hypothetical protein KC330_g64 [Hortaea werneckii]|nr:hypothetical protein KC330_g64 [Hortaea werneckii]
MSSYNVTINHEICEKESFPYFPFGRSLQSVEELRMSFCGVLEGSLVFTITFSISLLRSGRMYLWDWRLEFQQACLQPCSLDGSEVDARAATNHKEEVAVGFENVPAPLNTARIAQRLSYQGPIDVPHEETKSPSAYYRGDQSDSYSELEEKDSRTSSESVRTVRYAPQAVESDRAPPSRQEPRHGFSRKQSLASLTRKLSGLLGHGGSVKEEVNEEFGNDEPGRRKLSRKFSLPQFRGIGSLRKGSRAHEADETCSKVSYLAPSLARPDKQDRAELWSLSLSQDLLDFKGLDADKEVSTAPCSGFGEYERLGHHYHHGQRALDSSQRSGLSEKRHAPPPRLEQAIDARLAGLYGNHVSSAAGASSLTGRINAPVSTPPQIYELEDRTVSAGVAQKRVCSIDAAHGASQLNDSIQ